MRENIINVMLGLWNDGFRKQVIINNHGQLWMLVAAIQEFMKRYQLPGIFQVLDWHRAVREFFFPVDREDSLSTTFVHADESETSLALYLFPEGMVDMDSAVDTDPQGYMADGHFDKSVDPYRRPHRWSEGEGHFPIEMSAVPEGVVGRQTASTPEKAKRPTAAILSYLTMLHDDIRAAFPPGTVPPVEGVTLRTDADMEPYLREPQSPGWKSVYQLPMLGQIR